MRLQQWLRDRWAIFMLDRRPIGRGRFDPPAGEAGVTAPTGDGRPRLLIDLSVIRARDAGTGVQRVVRHIYLGLVALQPQDFELRPIAATARTGYRYLPIDCLTTARGADPCSDGGPVCVRRGDVYLGLDLAPRIINSRLRELNGWRHAGVRLAFFVYDLLPHLGPQWFNPRTVRHFRRWMKSLVILADGLVYVSHSVQDELRAWMGTNSEVPFDALAHAVVPLASDLHLRRDIQALPDPIDAGPAGYVLMVGTIEPRKAYPQALDAFEQLWSQGHDGKLVIVGRRGWKVDAFIARLEAHPELGRRLRWLDGPGDDTLASLYQHCRGLLMASHAEGYGLPLTEACRFGRPVLARDLPVFKEVMGGAARYFRGDSGDELAPALATWLRETEASAASAPVAPAGEPAWEDGCRQLLSTLRRWQARPDVHPEATPACD